MNPIKVKTPQGELLLSHIKRTVKATGPEIAVSWWKMEVNEGLYGVHGHLLDPNDCDVVDIISAASQAAGFANIEIPEEAQKQAEKDLKDYPNSINSLP
tara:strand:+ start:761 stop:1057 length:297 start_codon:yes stop_codon:yes gene_type:complete